MPQSIFSNAFIATLGRGVTLVCGVVATALMARMLGTSGLGFYSLVLTVGTILQLGADFGLYLTLSRVLGIQHGKPSEKIANIVSLRLALLATLFGLGLVVFLSVPSLRVSSGIFLIFALGLIFQSGSQLLMSVFQAYGCVWRASLGDIVGRVVQVALLGLGLIVFPEHNTPIWVAMAFSVGLVASFCIHVLIVPEKRLLRLRFSLAMWRQIMYSSWPIALMLILNVIYFRIDTILLFSLRTSTEVGLYSLAYKVIENGLFFPAMIGGLLLPAISSALSDGARSRAQKLVSQGLLLSLSGACMLVALLITFSHEIITILAGASFAESAPLLRILAIALGTMFLGNIFGFSLIALGKQKSLAILYFALVVGNIFANYVAIPIFGAAGAAWVTVATELSATVAAGFMVRRHIAWSIPYTQVGIIIFAAIGSIGVASIFSPMLFWVRLCVAIVLYISSMHYTGIWSLQSLSSIRSKQII